LDDQLPALIPQGRPGRYSGAAGAVSAERSTASRILALACLVVSLLVLIGESNALAGPNMIPPGQEQRIRELIDSALAEAQARDELPVELDARSSFAIDRDHIRVSLYPAEPHDHELPRVVVFHPQAPNFDAAQAIAPGIVLECGPVEQASPCPEPTNQAWTALGQRLAAAREPVVREIWALEQPNEASKKASIGAQIDRGAAIAAVFVGLALFGFAARRAVIPARELLGLVVVLVVFVAATVSLTRVLPLHEHNSFIARSACAIDLACVADPIGAWSMTSIHGYGLLLERIPQRAGALARLSLAISVVMLILVWAVTRRLAIELGWTKLAGVAGLVAVAVLASNPIVWRLSGAASFWPWSLTWVLGAALAGLWAARACVSEDRRERWAGALAWVLAAVCLAFAAAGNIVCLTLGVCLGLAPLCWTRAGAESSWSRAAARAAWIGPLAALAFALITVPDYSAGLAHAFRPAEPVVIGRFNPLLLDSSLVTPVWIVVAVAAVILALGLSWTQAAGPRAEARVRALRLLAPLAYAYVVPAAFLGGAAGVVVGSGYPVGFINHHWELVFTAIAVALVITWPLALLERRRPQLHGWIERWALLIPASLMIVALLLGPRAREGWRMATGERVLERELVALEHSLATLPEHELLIVTPRTLEALTDARSYWDPIEVNFPTAFYEHAMRERGLEPTMIIELDRLPRQLPAGRILVYLGSSTRSFQPHEIEANTVPDSLERPIIADLRGEWAFEPALTFMIATAQHEAISQRLGADRVAELELGFYWMYRLERRPPE